MCSDSDSEISTIRRTPVLIENNINNNNIGEEESINEEEDVIVGGRGNAGDRYRRLDDWRGYGRRREHRYLESSRHHPGRIVRHPVSELNEWAYY